MKHVSELRSEQTPKAWLASVSWAVVFFAAVALFYTGGDVSGRVCFLKGLLPDGSRRLAFVETVFRPVDYPYSHNKVFRAGFDRSVALFIRKQEGQ